MGVRIGDAISTVAAARATQGENRTRNMPERQAAETEETVRRVGFGENTVTATNAALDTIDRTLQRAARLIPKVEDVRRDFREQVELGTEERPETEEARPAQPEPQRVRPEPSPQVRNFEAALPAAPAEEAEANAAEREAAQPRNPVGVPRLDVFA